MGGAVPSRPLRVAARGIKSELPALVSDSAHDRDRLLATAALSLPDSSKHRSDRRDWPRPRQSLPVTRRVVSSAYSSSARFFLSAALDRFCKFKVAVICQCLAVAWSPLAVPHWQVACEFFYGVDVTVMRGKGRTRTGMRPRCSCQYPRRAVFKLGRAFHWHAIGDRHIQPSLGIMICHWQCQWVAPSLRLPLRCVEYSGVARFAHDDTSEVAQAALRRSWS